MTAATAAQSSVVEVCSSDLPDFASISTRRIWGTSRLAERTGALLQEEEGRGDVHLAAPSCLDRARKRIHRGGALTREAGEETSYPARSRRE